MNHAMRANVLAFRYGTLAGRQEADGASRERKMTLKGWYLFLSQFSGNEDLEKVLILTFSKGYAFGFGGN